jgi:hypothetical protein
MSEMLQIVALVLLVLVALATYGSRGKWLRKS